MIKAMKTITFIFYFQKLTIRLRQYNKISCLSTTILRFYKICFLQMRRRTEEDEQISSVFMITSSVHETVPAVYVSATV